MWYSGARADLWVEYKFLKDGKIPVRVPVDLITKQRYLSTLQLDWIDGRTAEGRNVWVIVGCKEGGVIYKSGTWHEVLMPFEFRQCIVDRKALALEIQDFVGPRL